ncbi:hypothetical protein INR49_024406, partial [Caranx melampygus]
MDYCQGGNLASKIRDQCGSPKETEILSWVVEICMALNVIHEKGLLHKHLTPENISFTKSGIVCLGNFGDVYENLKGTDSYPLERSYLPPEVFLAGSHGAKGDIWSLGCILYELCTKRPAFSAETTGKLMPKIIRGPYPSLPNNFSPELCELLNDIFNRDLASRPTASDILIRPFIIKCLSIK